jgi:uncharacterized membrane protein (DUF106 family)
MEDNEENKEGENTEAGASEDTEINREANSNDGNVVKESSDENQNNNSENPEPSGEANSEETKEEVEAPKEEPKDEPQIIPKNKEGKKEGSWTPMIVIMGLSMLIVFTWDKIPFIKDNVHNVLDPSAGALLNWDLVLGMLAIILVINIITTLIQKYATDQEALRELKKEQKILQAEMKKYKDHPEKVAELSKKQMQFIPKTMKLTSRAIAFTGVPFILFFRWFDDTFNAMEAATGVPIRFLGFLSWFWFYLISTMIFSSIFRKLFKVV